jgi:hypothetical protein
MTTTGRPRALDEIKQREICAPVTAGCSICEAARYVGCAPSTIHREAKRNDPFAEKLRHATTYAGLSPLQAMQAASRTHWRAAAWMLERTKPGRFARNRAKGLSAKQAKELGADLVDILDKENLDPFQQQRLEIKIQTTIECAIADAFGTERARRNRRHAIAYFASLDRNSDVLVQAGLRTPNFEELKGAHRDSGIGPSRKSHRRRHGAPGGCGRHLWRRPNSFALTWSTPTPPNQPMQPPTVVLARPNLLRLRQLPRRKSRVVLQPRYLRETPRSCGFRRSMVQNAEFCNKKSRFADFRRPHPLWSRPHRSLPGAIRRTDNPVRQLRQTDRIVRPTSKLPRPRLPKLLGFGHSPGYAESLGDWPGALPRFPRNRRTISERPR